MKHKDNYIAPQMDRMTVAPDAFMLSIVHDPTTPATGPGNAKMRMIDDAMLDTLRENDDFHYGDLWKDYMDDKDENPGF